MDQHPDGPRTGRPPRRQLSDQDLARRAESRRALDRRAEPEPAPASNVAGPGDRHGTAKEPDQDPARRPLYESDADLTAMAPGHSVSLHRDDATRQARDGRYPRSVKIAGVVAAAVVAGWAIVGTMGAGTKNDVAGGAQSGSPSVSSVPEDTDTGTPTPQATDTPSGAAPRTSAKTSATPSRSKISSSPSKSPTTSPRTSPSTPSSPAFTSLRLGSTGPAVSTLQKRLQQDGYVLEMLGFTDGTYDSATANAVAAFQTNHPGTAKADGMGVYGPATDAALRQEVQ